MCLVVYSRFLKCVLQVEKNIKNKQMAVEEQVETSIIKPARDERGRLLPGGTANIKGRPKDTTEKKIVKKAVKQYLEEYEESLAAALPEISPVLRKKAKGGDMAAIREIHEVVGAHKKASTTQIVDSNILILVEKANKILPE